MSRISEQISNSPVFNTLDTYKNLLSNIRIEKYDNEEIIIEFKRVQKVINYFESVLKAMDYELVAISTLNSINQHLSNAYTQLNSFVTNGSLANLKSSNDHLSNAIPFISTINILNTQDSAEITKQELEKLNDIIEDLIKSYTVNKKVIENQTQTYELNIEKLEKKIEVQVNRLDKAISDFQGVFQENQQNRTTEFNALVKKNEEKLVGEVNDFMNNATERLENAFLDIQKQIVEFKDSSNDILIGLSKDKEKASDLLKIITNIGTTGQFNKYSSSEERNYYIFTGVAVFFMSVAILLSYFFLVNVPSETTISIVSKIFTISLFFVPATYAVKEAAKHRKRQTYYRKMELELATIDTFIESLSQDKREEVKLELTKRLFGSNIDLDSNDSMGKAKADDISIQDISNILSDLGIKKESLIELLKSII